MKGVALRVASRASRGACACVYARAGVRVGARVCVRGCVRTCERGRVRIRAGGGGCAGAGAGANGQKFGKGRPKAGRGVQKNLGFGCSLVGRSAGGTPILLLSDTNYVELLFIMPILCRFYADFFYLTY